jgi:hypothetical protein
VDSLVLFQICSLHARTVQEAGLKIVHRGKEFYTGPIVAHLDQPRDEPGNLGLVDLASGSMRVRWCCAATLPFLADAISRGEVADHESGPVRVVFEESGHMLDDGDGFDVKGPGKVLDGSLFRDCIVATTNYAAVACERLSTGFFTRELASGRTVQLAFAPELCTLDVKLSADLGGTAQRLHLTGGFSVRAVMTLPRESLDAETDLKELAVAVS